MRPLKRPMFKTGGPIKEGVMNGLKDGGVATYMADATGYSGGGIIDKAKNYAMNNKLKLAGYGSSIPVGIDLFKYLFAGADGGIARLPMKSGGDVGAGLVGDPRYPQQGGRAMHNQYLFPETGTSSAMPRTKLNIKSIKDVPKSPGQAASLAAKIGAKKFLPKDFAKGAGTRGLDYLKKMFRKIEMPPKRISTGAPYGTNLTQAQIAQGMGTRPLTFLERVNMFRKANPRTFYGGLGVGTTSGAIPFGGAKLAELGGNLGLEVADRLVSDKFFDQDKVIGGNVREVFGKVKKALGFDEKDDDDNKDNKGRDLDADLNLKIKKSKAELDAEAAALKEIEDKQRLDKIYKLLGVDRAKSGAASKALIDMSRYIDEGGKDVISKKNIGSTISKAIGAFDKRLDKVDQLKEAAGLMMAKSELEKELYKEKGNASTQAINALSKASGRSPAYVANAKLGIANSPAEAKAQLAKMKNMALTSDSVTAVIQQYADENGIKFQKQITTDQKNDKVGKGKEYATVVDLVEDLELDPKGSDDGLYVIGTSIVQVDKGVAKLKG